MDSAHIPELTPPTAPGPGPSGLVREALNDIQAVRRADPAARTLAEVLATYPGLHALWLHRIAHGLWRREHFFMARALSHYARHITGVEIHPGAVMGRGVFIDHGMGVVIGETAVVGDECLIYKGVVLGGTTLQRTKRHPTLGRGVTVGSNACILGAVHIGDGARVGSGSVVVKDVPAHATAVGVPGRVVSQEHRAAGSGPNLDHGALPDPMQRLVRDLLGQIEQLSQRLESLEATAHGLDRRPSEEQRVWQSAMDQEVFEAFAIPAERPRRRK